MLGEQQGGNQVAADDEEDLDAQEAGGQEVDAGVVENDDEDGEGAEAIEAGQIGQARGLEFEAGGQADGLPAAGKRRWRIGEAGPDGDGHARAVGAAERAPTQSF